MPDDLTTVDFYFLTGALYSLLLIYTSVIGLLYCFKFTEKEATHNLLKFPLWAVPLCALIILFAYGAEIFVAFYSGSQFELEAFKIRMTGPYWWAYLFPIISHIPIVFFLIPFVRKSLPFVTVSALIAMVFSTGIFEAILIALEI